MGELYLHDEVADDHPERVGVRQAKPPIGVREGRLQQRVS
jgi:hypothetical protein